MDEGRENIPPTECPSPHRDGVPRCVEANPLPEAFHFTTPAQYSRNGGVKSKSQTPCLLPDITPVSRYLLSRRRVLTNSNSPSPDFVSIRDETLPQVSFDVSTIEGVADGTAISSPVFNQDGAAAQAIGSCSHLENITVSLENTMESPAKLTNQTTTISINDTFDDHPPGPSKCNNVTADADPTGKMVALQNTFDAVTDAEADPAEGAVSESEARGSTFETESVSALCSTHSLFESRTSVSPQNTFDMGSSTSLPNQTTTRPTRVNPQNTFNMDSSTSLPNQTTTSPIRVNSQNTIDMDSSTSLPNQTTTSPIGVNPQNTFDSSGSTRPMRVNPQNTFDISGSTRPVRVNPQNTFDMDSSAMPTNQTTSPENDTFDVHPPGPAKCKDTTVDAELNAKMVDLHMTFDEEQVVVADCEENEPVVVAVSQDELGVVSVSKDEPGVVAVSEDEVGIVAVSEDEPVVVAVSEDEPGVVAVSEAEPVVVAVSEYEPGVVAVSEDEVVVVAVSEDEPGVVVVSEAEQVVVAVTEDEPGVVAVAEDEPGVVAVSEAELGVVALSQAELGVVALSEAEPDVVASSENATTSGSASETDSGQVGVSQAESGVVVVSQAESGVVPVSVAEPVVRAVSEAETEDMAVTGPGNSKDNSQSSTLKMDGLSDSPALVLYSSNEACNNYLDDSLELRQEFPANLKSTPMPHSHPTETVLDKASVVPRKLYQSHSQFVPPTNTVESDSQFVPPTNLVSDRKMFMNPNNPRVKHLLPPSVSMIPGGNSKKHTGLPMMRRAQTDGTAALPKEATGIPRSVVPEAKGIPKAIGIPKAMETPKTMVTRSDTGAVLPGAGLRKRQGGGLPLPTQRAMPALRPPLTRSMAGLAAKTSVEPTVHTNAAPAVPLLRIGQPPNRRDLRSGTSSGEAALLAKKKMDVPVPSSSAAGPSQTVKTGQSQTLKRPGGRLALPGAKQKKIDDPVLPKASSAPSQPGKAARGLQPPTANQRAPPPKVQVNAVAQRQLGEAQQEIAECRGEIGRLPDCANCAVAQRQLEEARQEIRRLQDLLQNGKE